MNKGLIGGLVALGLIGVTAGVCVGVPQIRNEIVGIYHDVEDKVNDTDLKNEIADLQLKLDDLTNKYNAGLENFNLLKQEKANLENQIEEIQANNELTISEKEELINSLNEELESYKNNMAAIAEENRALLVKIESLEEQLKTAENIVFNKLNLNGAVVNGVGPVFEYLHKKYIDKRLVFDDGFKDAVGFLYEKDASGKYCLYLVNYENDVDNPEKIGIISSTDYYFNHIEITINDKLYRVYDFSYRSLDDVNDNYKNLGIYLVTTDLRIGVSPSKTETVIYFGGNCGSGYFTDDVLKHISSLKV